MKKRMQALLPRLTEEQAEKFQIYYEMLTDWNTRLNLTAITDPDGIAKKHFVDSLAAEPLLIRNARCIDVGTGAGFPGIPLLIVRPDLFMTFLDGLNKRLVFVDAVCRELGFSDRMKILHARAEDAGRDPAEREQYDAALTRAVASLPVLLELTVPLVKIGGICVNYKGDAAEEILLSARAADVLNCTMETVPVSSDYGVRTLVKVKKNGKTPKTYPRKAGTPAKQPL